MEVQIIDIIRGEVGIKEDDLYIWNKMLKTISQIDLDDKPQTLVKLGRRWLVRYRFISDSLKFFI